MSIQVTVNGQSYNLPEQGDNPPWGQDLSDLIQALVTVSNASLGPNDISNTNFTPANNQTSPSNVTSLSFDPSAVRSAIISYSCYRSTASNEVSECGQMIITFYSMANTWELARYAVGDAGITFTITPAGQVQYVSTNITGTGYSAKLEFAAKSFLQT